MEPIYKLTKPNGYDFYSDSINYAKNIGKIIRVDDYAPSSAGIDAKGLHASKNPNNCFIRANIPCRAFEVEGIDKITSDELEGRYQALRVIREIHDLNKLFGWDYEQAINMVNPFKTKAAPQIGTSQLALLKQVTKIKHRIMRSVWNAVGVIVGNAIWDNISNEITSTVGAKIKAEFCKLIPDIALDAELEAAWDISWHIVWDATWEALCPAVAAYLGSFFKAEKWKHISDDETYPFQPYVDLWKQGLVPARYEGNVWRLYGGPKAEVIWKGVV